MIERNARYTTQVSGRTVVVRPLEVEQRWTGRKHGKWVCVSEESNAKVWRTERQLHRVLEEEAE